MIRTAAVRALMWSPARDTVQANSATKCSAHRIEPEVSVMTPTTIGLCVVRVRLLRSQGVAVVIWPMARSAPWRTISRPRSRPGGTSEGTGIRVTEGSESCSSVRAEPIV